MSAGCIYVCLYMRHTFPCSMSVCMKYLSSLFILNLFHALLFLSGPSLLLGRMRLLVSIPIDGGMAVSLSVDAFVECNYLLKSRDIYTL